MEGCKFHPELPGKETFLCCLTCKVRVRVIIVMVRFRVNRVRVVTLVDLYVENWVMGEQCDCSLSPSEVKLCRRRRFPPQEWQ